MREVRAEGKCKLGHEFVEGDAICRWIRLEASHLREGFCGGLTYAGTLFLTEWSLILVG